ncbi:UvrD-helicase domain-containing protein [Elizabethkingia sp. HX XZB]|uniref:UvrD-helicase domain-containing protein n=1 Tax=Elizabethkingia sp. HX XZB TaxID=3003193 RepID=UPI002A23B9F8|nr:UvrD-helicase domain-containing protein [Elizabethkingia sp. HX XZB]MDX8567362.1 UvrD-helicase domain-containing protein [Elizabethkingia sp. HX XZB]
MVKRELGSEIEQILTHIKSDRSFILSGGAGSGKTYTLVQCIKNIIDYYPNKTIACITYTNAAVKEIEGRINHENLYVSTIHDFLWDCIKNFQKELKEALISLATDPEIKDIKISPITEDLFWDKTIQYKENLNLRNGIISHDELIIVAEFLFEKYVKLSDIIKDKFQFILIDEYQDTHEKVVKILLEHFKLSSKKNIIGFFGDSMQSIYEKGVGNIDKYKGSENNTLAEVIKVHNRRNPSKVISLANKLRLDGIVQEPQLEKTFPAPPNMDDTGKIKEGDIKFIYSSSYDLDNVRKYLKWDFDDSFNTKELNLTHNLIAKQAKFSSLMNIYNSDQIIAFKNTIVSYLRENPGVIIDNMDTFGVVIIKTGLSPDKGKMQRFIDENNELFEEAKSYLYSTFSKIYLASDILTDDKKQKENEENKKGSKRDNLLKHLFKIQNCIRLYNENKFNEFLKITSYQISSINDKIELKQHIEELSEFTSNNIGDIIEKADEYNIVSKDQKLLDFILQNEYVYNRICKVDYEEFYNLYNYLEGYTPFSTQHKTKGAEFNNVLVILDNGNWNNYNFKYLFTNNSDKETILNRTKKIFYVCCTRAKENLAVFYHDPKPQENILATARSWFGDSNVIDLDSIGT